VQPISVELWVVDLDVTKLKNLGLDWDHFASKKLNAASTDVIAFVKALRQYGFARILCEPTLVTKSGRPASLEVGALKLDVVPILKGDNRIQVDYRLELAEGDSRFRCCSAFELEAGTVATFSQVRPTSTEGESESREITRLIIVRASPAK
jgi:type II secretory pathway component GspD/PulD (secretin)